MSEERTEFGFKRTVAAGPTERAPCKCMPGYLVPADLERMSKAMGSDDIKAWATKYLLASPGAKVAGRDPKTGKLITFQVPTLVPARNANDHCVHLSPDGLCDIHAVAPFGCAFFDMKMGKNEGDNRSLAGLRAIIDDMEVTGLYSQLWEMLNSAGKKAPPPSICRQRLEVLVERAERKEKERRK